MKLISMTKTMTTFCIFLLLFFYPHPSLAARVGPTSIHRRHWRLPSKPSSSSLKGFNVRSFGARGDGKTDATKAFLDAWNAACSSSIPSQIYVPNGRYLLKPLIFEGSCKSSILFQIDGTLVAPDDYSVMANAYSWIVFHQVNGLQIKGGTIDAKGKNLWDCKAAHRQCQTGAKSLSFDNSQNVMVDGLTSINSQLFHITINACQNMNMGGLTIVADANSPNTDGIHIERSKEITIAHSQFRTGDDCISIGPNNENILIENISCGPGHGISIGSLGRDSDDGVVVRNVTVKSVTFTGTDNGLRIKTFATPIRGFVKDIYFLGATMNNVRNPIIIDQEYCPQGNCLHGQASGIQINNVVYNGVHGTSSSPDAVIFDCSTKKPCVGLTLQNINLSYQSHIPECESKNAYGKSIGPLQPSSCLVN